MSDIHVHTGVPVYRCAVVSGTPICTRCLYNKFATNCFRVLVVDGLFSPVEPEMLQNILSALPCADGSSATGMNCCHHFLMQ